VAARTHRPRRTEVIRVLAALVLLLQFNFDIAAPAVNWAGRAIDGVPGAHSGVTELAGWIIAVVLAGMFVFLTRIGQRQPPRKPGMILLTLGLAAIALGAASAGHFGDWFSDRSYARAMIARIWMMIFGGFSAPMTTIGNALMSVGLLRVLFDLDPLPRRIATIVERPRTGSAAAATQDAADLPAVRAASAAQPDDVDLHRRLHELLLRDFGHAAELRTHGRDYIALLARRAKHQAALDVYAQLRERDTAFAPAPDDVAALAETALGNRQYQLAVRVVNRFDQRHPEHPANALVYLLAAKALLGLERKEQAIQVLQVLLQRHGTASHAWEAKVLLQSLRGT